MSMTPTSRRELFRIAAAGAVAVGAVAVSASPASAYQGNMERAIGELYDALGSLREATSDKGGHKANAMNLIQQAISEVQAGIDYAAANFGD
jgi:hypothetical protein